MNQEIFAGSRKPTPINSTTPINSKRGITNVGKEASLVAFLNKTGRKPEAIKSAGKIKYQETGILFASDSDLSSDSTDLDVDPDPELHGRKPRKSPKPARKPGWPD